MKTPSIIHRIIKCCSLLLMLGLYIVNYVNIVQAFTSCQQHKVALFAFSIGILLLFSQAVRINHHDKTIIYDMLILLTMPLSAWILSSKWISDKMKHGIIASNRYFQCDDFFATEENVRTAIFALSIIFVMISLLTEMGIYWHRKSSLDDGC